MSEFPALTPCSSPRIALCYFFNIFFHGNSMRNNSIYNNDTLNMTIISTLKTFIEQVPCMHCSKFFTCKNSFSHHYHYYTDVETEAQRYKVFRVTQVIKGCTLDANQGSLILNHHTYTSPASIFLKKKYQQTTYCSSFCSSMYLLKLVQNFQLKIIFQSS